jgi:c-di-GMP-specific phosphodiesterase
MNSCDFRVFLQEFGTTVHLSLPGSVSEKERLLLKLLMQGMSVTEISQYRNRSAKTISHQKKQLFEKLGIQSDITFWRDIFFQYNPEIISATGNNSHKYINDNHYHKNLPFFASVDRDKHLRCLHVCSFSHYVT